MLTYFKVGRSRLFVTHLLYANDTLFYRKGNDGKPLDH